jgi:hypothetical protein
LRNVVTGEKDKRIAQDFLFVTRRASEDERSVLPVRAHRM